MAGPSAARWQAAQGEAHVGAAASGIEPHRIGRLLLLSDSLIPAAQWSVGPSVRAGSSAR